MRKLCEWCNKAPATTTTTCRCGNPKTRMAVCAAHADNSTTQCVECSDDPEIL